MASRRSQYATEYLAVVAISAIIVASVIVVLMNHYQNVRYTLSTHQAYSAANDIKESAMTVYYLGEGSMTTLYLKLPEGIEESSLEDNEIMFRIKAVEDINTDVYVVSPIEIEGTLPDRPGTYKITLTSQGDKVWLEA